jgi:hypothetical protein
MNDEKITQLETALAEAEQAMAVLFQNRREPGFSLAEWVLANDRVMRAQRALAAAKGEEHAVPVNLGVVPEAAVPEPELFQTERGAYLVFSAVKVQMDGVRRDAGFVVVEIEFCSLTQFGYPNDEALPGHPLSNKGLEPYGVFEVLGSSWIQSMTKMNRVEFPETPDSSQRHFIFTFHDSTFECIARSIRLAASGPTREEARAWAWRKLFALDILGDR